MFGLLMMDLVDGNGGVNDRGLNDFFLKDGLNGFVDCPSRSSERDPRQRRTGERTVMMNMLAGHRRRGGLRVDGRGLRASIAELATFLLETTTDGSVIAMINVSLLDGGDMVLVLFGKHLTILDGLDGGVIMILMHLTIYNDNLRQPSFVGDVASSRSKRTHRWPSGPHRDGSS